MTCIQAMFMSEVRSIEMQGKTKLPKPVQIVAWEAFERDCNLVIDNRGHEVGFGAQLTKDGPLWARKKITEALVAYIR